MSLCDISFQETGWASRFVSCSYLAMWNPIFVSGKSHCAGDHHCDRVRQSISRALGNQAIARAWIHLSTPRADSAGSASSVKFDYSRIFFDRSRTCGHFIAAERRNRAVRVLRGNSASRQSGQRHADQGNRECDQLRAAERFAEHADADRGGRYRQHDGKNPRLVCRNPLQSGHP